MLQPNFDYAAKWVCQRQQNDIPEAEISQALSTLHNLAGKCKAAVMIPDLFPGTPLEAIYIPADSGDDVSSNGGRKFMGEARITVPALSAIGAAVIAELESTGNDMVVYDFDDGAQAIAYLPDVRNTVLQFTGLTLLGS